MSIQFCKLVLCSILAVTAGSAQDRGTITGIVTDNSGAAVPGAKISVLNPATGFTQSATSTAEGGYTFLYLAAGKYTVAAEKDGFRKSEIADVQVQVNTATRMDIRLQVGTLTETVEVTGTAVMLQTD